ncbi:mechanosensitive ion channel family protein [Salinimonas lutimaris]|uniref:mechanosensitive ion channel family protein n=1 Tax=Salinimonas lutimaris TaxID=914153 RepID=UPI0010C150C4|nr:mechanosensitive ion channel family protein [Salinimonas lutimaris]
MFRDVTAFVQMLSAAVPDFLEGVLALVIAILLARPLSHLCMRPFSYFQSGPLLHSVIRRSFSLLIILLGLYIFLKQSGLTEFAVAIMSGTGIVGLILGFAFRDIAENFISSLLLTVQRPFKIGDVVTIASYTGVIQKVTARATTLVDFDGNHIQLPNASVYKGIIKNLTANPNMRGQLELGVGYDNDISQVRQLAQTVLGQHQFVLDSPEPLVLIDNLGASTVNLKVYFWINAEVTSIVKITSSLFRQLLATFEQAGISMPDDAREIIFPQGVPVVNSVAQNSPSGGQKNEVSSPPAKNGSLPHASDKYSTDSHHTEDVASETSEIRRQAKHARDPEDGDNIL